MPWTQFVKAFQEHFETGNCLSLGLADPLRTTVDSFIGPILSGPGVPKEFRYQLFSIFKEQFAKIYKMFRSSPTDS
jgi:hypothetical protein